MSMEIVAYPFEWHVEGNLIPSDLADLDSTTFYTATDCILANLTATTIDGNSLKRLQVTADF